MALHFSVRKESAESWTFALDFGKGLESNFTDDHRKRRSVDDDDFEADLGDDIM